MDGSDLHFLFGIVLEGDKGMQVGKDIVKLFLKTQEAVAECLVEQYGIIFYPLTFDLYPDNSAIEIMIRLQ